MNNGKLQINRFTQGLPKQLSHKRSRVSESDQTNLIAF